MTTNYTINLVNHGSTAQTFWCFLAPPEELASNPKVFANSAASLQVDPYSPNSNFFVVPAQYVVAAGASNNAVGLGVQIVSTITQNTDLGVLWKAAYADVPPNAGPSLTQSGPITNGNQVAIAANNFNQTGNEDQGWYSSMSFGIRTQSGFMGMTWSPSPGDRRTLTPTLKFYVSTGNYGVNELASWTDVSTSSAVLTAPNDFEAGQATVTLDGSGNWTVTPGRPTDAMLRHGGRRLEPLIRSHLLLAQAHADLVRLAAPSSVTQNDTVASVKWTTSLEDTGNTYLSGTVTVTAALTAAFSAFVLAGVDFSIVKAPAGGTTINFTYSGQKSADFVKSLFTAGAQMVLRQQPSADPTHGNP